MTDLRVKYSLDSRNYANLLQMWQDVDLENAPGDFVVSCSLYRYDNPVEAYDALG